MNRNTLLIRTAAAISLVSSILSGPLVASSLAVPAPSNPSPAPSETCLLFSYFVGNGEDGLHLARSADGYKWEAIGGGKSFLTPKSVVDGLSESREKGNL